MIQLLTPPRTRLCDPHRYCRCYANHPAPKSLTRCLAHRRRAGCGRDQVYEFHAFGLEV
ncbi:hypothetical protein AG1IA_07205 [Rhizoctonia solani AG-1 IA]|uniref:Uncharacterized protein n=1 Tax=Thanatephorus cucumeris (strain AG1-IA) TaxID=983506 RepID=L8WR18_THACA|nr:hypothetical protein AG1IA_07205 [Rhizoctonia solani AG-1 IA]